MPSPTLYGGVTRLCRLRAPSVRKNAGEDRRAWRMEPAASCVAILCILSSPQSSASTCSGEWSEEGPDACQHF